MQKSKSSRRIKSGFKYLLNFLCFVTLVLGLAGCITTSHKPLAIEHTAFDDPVLVISVVPQEEIVMTINELHTADVSPGVLFMLIDHGVNKSRTKKADKRIQPLLQAAEDINLTEVFWKALEQRLATSAWMKTKEIERRTEPYDREEYAKIPVPFLSMNTTFFLSPDAKELIAQSHVKLFLTDRWKPDYVGTYFYYSEKIGAPEVADEEAITLWAADDAAIYRNVLERAIEELLLMMDYDLLGNPAQPETETGAEMAFTLWDATYARLSKYEGRIIREDDDRIFMRVTGGNLFSIAKASIIEQKDIAK